MVGLRRTSRLPVSALILITAPLLVSAYVPLCHAQTFQVLHEFTGGADGAIPQGLTVDGAGNVYGVAGHGGRNGSDCYEGCGVAYELSRHGSIWLFGVLHTFQDKPDGASPLAPMIFGPHGALYGSTAGGGLAGMGNNCHNSGCGTIFKLQPPATVCRATSCPWVETVLYRFTGAADGDLPNLNDALVFDQSGNLYGTTNYGGYTGGSCGANSGCGVVFELSPSNEGWTETVLYSFQDGGNGAYPEAGVIFDQYGNLYGTNEATVYELEHSGSSWTYNVLLRIFDADIAAGVIFDPFGRLFSATQNGGTGGGNVFGMSRADNDWVPFVMYNLGLPHFW